MVLPGLVLAVKALGWAQALLFCAISNRQAARLYKASDITSSSTGSPGLLLAYRLVMLAWGLFIGLRQLQDKGGYVFVFYTVWNWWMLVLFFALASAASMRGWKRRRRAAAAAGARGSSGSGRGGGGGGAAVEQQCSLDWLDRATVATFTIEAPAALLVDAMTWLVLVPMLEAGAGGPGTPAAKYWRAAHHNFESYNMSIALDAITWTVLVPGLMHSARHDPALLQFWQQRLFCFESYNHGFNAAMMLGEVWLNRIPVTFFSSGWLALFSSAFGVWSGLFYARNGRFIYPFLDAHKPYAWASYLALFAVHWAAFLIIMGVARFKEWVLFERRGAGRGAAAHPAAPSPAAPSPKKLR